MIRSFFVPKKQQKKIMNKIQFQLKNPYNNSLTDGFIVEKDNGVAIEIDGYSHYFSENKHEIIEIKFAQENLILTNKSPASYRTELLCGLSKDVMGKIDSDSNVSFRVYHDNASIYITNILLGECTEDYLLKLIKKSLDKRGIAAGSFMDCYFTELNVADVVIDDGRLCFSELTSAINYYRNTLLTKTVVSKATLSKLDALLCKPYNLLSKKEQELIKLLDEIS